MEITGEAIRLDNQIFPTKNISSARMVEKDIKVPESDKDYTKRMVRNLAIGVILMLVGIANKDHEDNQAISLVGLICGAYFIFFTWKRKFFDAKQYGIELLSNSGTMTLFWSRDLEFMTQVRDVIFKALTTSSTTLHYNVNIDNKKIFDNSLNITEKSTTNIYDYSIRFTKNEGISDEQLQFLNGEFNNTLRELGKAAEASRNTDLEGELKNLVQILRSNNPEKTKIRNAWAKVKGVCEVWETGEDVQKIISTLGAGIATIITMFS
ncbi:DUF6232 family protein [Rhizobium sp. CECT 9324]|uniref:DUF6232 family protein n=1 Tax=Rhizobium sp. CECT 9324 TaxID=2845820 RepID=UPI001E569F5D|nr:DUF6232 family protein [Rhizobium sp. CECT 9324]CAH0341472.1 hypothetical protein RHI9324_03167 [Rhizobium sp. CECT 9324]